MAIDYIDDTELEEEEFVNKEIFVSVAQDKEIEIDDGKPDTETIDLSKIKELAEKYKEKKEKQKLQEEEKEKKEFLNTDNDNTDKNKEIKENAKKPIENNEKKAKNNSVKEKEIVLPKGFEYLLDIVKQYNKVLKLVKNPDFVQNVLQQAVEKKIEEKSEEIAESFAEETIQELEKNTYFEIAEEKKELEFIFNMDVDKCEILNIVGLDKTKFKQKIIFDPNYIYDFYFKIININNNISMEEEETINNYKEIFEFLKNQEFFVEDYFII